MRILPTLLLATYLTNLDGTDALDGQRLFGWLGVSLSIGGNQSSAKEVQEVRSWFGSHPNQYKAIFAMATESSTFPWTPEEYLFHAPAPPDFGSWCLDQALSAEDQEPARRFLDRAFVCLYRQDNSEGLSKEALEKRIARRPILLNHYKAIGNHQRQFIDRQEQRQKAHLKKEQKDEGERQRNRENWQNEIKSLEPDFRRNSAPPKLLHQLAGAYFGFFLDIDGNTGRERLLSLLGGDERLVDIALKAFRESTKRGDLPQAPEILHLSVQNQQHDLALPFAAGLQELAGELSAGQPPLDEDGMRRALALHFSEILPPNDKWLGHELILAYQPDVVAESMVQVFRATIRKGGEHRMDLYQLAHDPGYSEVACIACPQLMKTFPIAAQCGS